MIFRKEKILFLQTAMKVASLFNIQMSSRHPPRNTQNDSCPVSKRNQSRDQRAMGMSTLSINSVASKRQRNGDIDLNVKKKRRENNGNWVQSLVIAFTISSQKAKRQQARDDFDQALAKIKNKGRKRDLQDETVRLLDQLSFRNWMKRWLLYWKPWRMRPIMIKQTSRTRNPRMQRWRCFRLFKNNWQSACFLLTL